MKPVPALLLVLSWFLAATTAVAQQLSPEEEKVWKDFLEAKELNDVRAMEKIAQRNKNEMTKIFEDFEGQLAYSDSIDLWDQYRMVGRALDDADSSNSHAVMMRILEKMPMENRQKRYDIRDDYNAASAAATAAKSARDDAALQEAIANLQDSAQRFEAIGDPVWQAYSLAVIANALNDNNQQLDAVKLYEQIDKLLTGVGFEKFHFLGQVRSSRDRLIAAGYNPDAKPGEQGPAGNTGTSWSDDPAGQRYSDPVPLKLVVEPKITSKYKTPSRFCTDVTFRWPSFRVNGDKPVQFEDRFKPFGQAFKVRRDGVKCYLDDGENKELEFKVIQKPNVVEMKRMVKDIDGNEQELEYAWLAATGGQESLFGLQINFTPSQEGVNIRYHSACYLKGKVLGEDIMIFDDNSSGRFGDPVAVRDGSTLDQPTYIMNDAMLVGREKVAGPWTEYMQVDGDFYRLKLDPDNYSVRTRKLSVDTGTVRYAYEGKVKPSVLVIEETREFKGAFFAIDERNPTVVPVGTYRISHGIIRSGSGKQEKTVEIFPGDSVAFVVKKDEEHVLELGEPFTFDFKHERTPDGSVKVVGKSVVVKGKAEELYIRFFDEPPIPDKVTCRAKGSSGGKTEKMEKADFEIFRDDTMACFSPLDLIFEGKAGTDYEVQMQLKKHALLGGPIKSDWK